MTGRFAAAAFEPLRRERHWPGWPGPTGAWATLGTFLGCTIGGVGGAMLYIRANPRVPERSPEPVPCRDCGEPVPGDRAICPVCGTPRTYEEMAPDP